MSACAAPFSSVYFQPDGVVKSCCATGLELGRLSPRSGVTIASILAGTPVAEHAAALDAGDFSLGCEECGIPARQGRREDSLAAMFDRYASEARPPFPRVMDFALSNRCNLQCVMCNGRLSSAIRAHRERGAPLAPAYGEAFFSELADYLPHLDLAIFKGGEPFLSPETQRVWDLMLELEVRCETSVTTNATIWNARVERYLRDLRMHAIVSVDGMTAATLESIRVGVHFDQLWNNIDRIQQVTSDTGRGMTLSWCLMPQNCNELGGFLVEAERRACSSNVVWVNQPAAFDLNRLPLDERERIASELEAQDAEVEDQLTGIRRSTWRACMARMRAWASPLPGPEPHLVAGPTVRRRHEPSESRLVTVTQELTEWAGVPPLVMTVSDWRIVRVRAPAWATPLDSHTWTGLHREDVLPLLSELLGHDTQVRMAPRSDGLPDHTLIFRVPGTRAERSIRVVTVPDADLGDPSGTYLMVPTASAGHEDKL